MSDPPTDEEIIWSILDAIEETPNGQLAGFPMVYELFLGERRRNGRGITMEQFQEELHMMAGICNVAWEKIEQAKMEKVCNGKHS